MIQDMESREEESMKEEQRHNLMSAERKYKKQKKEIVDTRKDELDVISCLADALKKYDQTIIDHYQDLMTKQTNVRSVMSCGVLSCGVMM